MKELVKGFRVNDTTLVLTGDKDVIDVLSIGIKELLDE